MSKLINPEFCELINKHLTTPYSHSPNYFPDSYRIPVYKLDEIPVIIELYKYSHTEGENFYGIKIDTAGLLNDDHEPRRLYTKPSFTTINDALSFFVNEFLLKFKIDILRGKITIEENKEEEDKLLLEFCDLFNDNEKIKTLYEKCVVCYEPTRTTTGCCKCALCLRCASKIEFEDVDENADEVEFGFKCPHCRQINDILKD